MTIRDIWEESLSVALFQPWDPHRALDPCLFDLALNLRWATNVLGRIFQVRKTAALMFFKTKGDGAGRGRGGEERLPQVSSCLCGSPAPPVGRRQHRPSSPVKLHQCVWLKAVLFYFRLLLFCH